MLFGFENSTPEECTAFDNKGEGDKAWVIKWIIFIANPATTIFSSLLAINSQRDRGGV